MRERTPRYDRFSFIFIFIFKDQNEPGVGEGGGRSLYSNVNAQIYGFRFRFLDLLDYLVPNHVSPSFATVQNSSAGSTPLHWATLNKQLDVVKRLVELCGA